jgi:hypothetical protein
MIDLETLSKRSDAAIVQIAAVAFDPETGEILSRFNRHVFETNEEFVGHIDVDTVAWWLTQAGAAHLGNMILKNGSRIGSALLDLSDWFGVLGSDVEAVWAHGATFDFPILESALERCGFMKPWHYRTPRDTRTLFAFAPGGCPVVAVDETRKHDALYDCEIQVQQVCGALAALRLQESLAEETTRTGVERPSIDWRATALSTEEALTAALAEVERWKEEYRVTEAARASFEAADTERALPPTRGGANETHDDPPVPGGYSGFAQTVVAGQQ